MDTLRRWGRDDLTTSGALLVTELVTNAVLHARTMVQVCLERRDEIVRVEVRDGSPVRPAQRNHGLDATTGRGLTLVARLAASWGVDMGGNGKVVWAHLAEDTDDDQWADVSFVVPDSGDPDVEGPHDGPPPSASNSTGDVRSSAVPNLGRCA